MPIHFTCPHCGKQTNVAESFAGQSGPCSGCGRTVTVPSGESAIAPAATTLHSAKPAPAGTGGSGSGAVIAVVTTFGVVGVLLCGGLIAVLFMPSLSSIRTPATRNQCMNNMRQIGLAFHNYHDTFNTFPPAYIADEEGRPRTSWRTMILPFLEQQPLYAQYDFNVAWDDPRNMHLSSISVAPFQCPDAQCQPGETNYMVIVGPSTVFDGDKACKFRDIIDGSSNTILVVEVVGTGVKWSEPVDIDVSKVNVINGPPSSNHKGGFNALLCDGSTRFLPVTISPNDLQALITRNGGEIISTEAY